MKVLIINTSERVGGAAIAAGRLTESLCNAGIEARMLVLHPSGHSPHVISIGKKWQKQLAFIGERLVIWANNLFSRKNLFTVSIANTGFDVNGLPAFREADVIHLHWTNQGMLSLKGIENILSSGKPVVWTMHDMWACTSICHYAYGCDSFKSGCKECPFLRFPRRHDLSNRVFRRKLDILQKSTMEIVTVSHWLSEQAQQSALLKEKRITVIPNTLSLSEFRIFDKTECRKMLSLPADKLIISFGAARIDDSIKGFDTLLDAIRILIKQKRFRAEEIHLALFGKIKFPEKVFPLIPVSYTHFGWITDTSYLSRIYSASDATVSASLYETFGQTLVESQACGCLPISFGNSGQADIICHKENGYIAEYGSAKSLSEGIEWAACEGQANIARENIRESVLKRYSGEVVAAQYANLYNQMIRNKE